MLNFFSLSLAASRTEDEFFYKRSKLFSEKNKKAGQVWVGTIPCTVDVVSLYDNMIKALLF